VVQDVSRHREEEMSALAQPAFLNSLTGVLFILLGTAAVWLIFDASRRVHSPSAKDRLLQAHRAAGYLFIAVFCFMTWSMVLRTRNGPEELPLPSMVHILLAMVLAPLLLVKLLIARYYKTFTAALVPLGLTIFTIGFVLIATTAGPYLLRRSTMKNISLQAIDLGGERIDLRAAESLMQKRCSSCHSLERVVSARKDAEGWLGTINRMRALPSSRIPEADARIILSYLISENSVDSSSAQGELAIGKALVDSHCNRCHALDRVYKAAKNPDEWRETLTRMVQYAHGTEGFFKPGEEERILRFLSERQTPAVRTRVAITPDTPGEIGKKAEKDDPAVPVDRESRLGTAGVVLAVVAGFGTMMWRRPRSHLRESAGPSIASPEIPPPASLPASSRKSILLQLIRVERQTHDCVSLRFRVPEPDAFRAKPGQFLTFDWLLDGAKVVRSYSISSSPTQRGFVEITVKKALNGYVSAFLNERTPANLTVEARGPSGRFCFDETQHRKIILFAGGSGITPLISMLRYIDDRCLDTDVILYYSVRSELEIIFAKELERLQGRLRNFRRIIILTKPDSSWTGLTGRISREMIVEQIADINQCTCFLCGPEPFMDHVHAILRSMNVDQRQIFREKFGGQRQAMETKPAAAEVPAGIIEFARSSKKCTLVADCTLLEIAELNAVNIPYSCRQGQCGTCATRVESGAVRMDCEDGLDPALKAQGYVLTCVGRARGSVRLEA
jgi:ferredoxin-NADP reductase/mono/diheme cytochrome c family protein